jgi:hypothetical protein
MPDGYTGTAIKYARDEKELMGFMGTKPDRNGIFRFKRGGIGKVLSISILK